MPPTFHSDWFSNNIPVWDRLLHPLKHKPSLQFLEIGSFEGRSSCWLLENVLTDPMSHLTCVDTFTQTPGDREYVKKILPDFPDDFDMETSFRANIASLGAENRVTVLRGKSTVMLKFLPLQSYDFIYIDGSHFAADVWRDIGLCWDLVKTGGILAFDDYQLAIAPGPLVNPGITIDAFLKIFEGRYEILEKGWQMILRKNESID